MGFVIIIIPLPLLYLTFLFPGSDRLRSKYIDSSGHWILNEPNFGVWWKRFVQVGVVEVFNKTNPVKKTIYSSCREPCTPEPREYRWRWFRPENYGPRSFGHGSFNSHSYPKYIGYATLHNPSMLKQNGRQNEEQNGRKHGSVYCIIYNRQQKIAWLQGLPFFSTIDCLLLLSKWGSVVRLGWGLGFCVWCCFWLLWCLWCACVRLHQAIANS